MTSSIAGFSVFTRSGFSGPIDLSFPESTNPSSVHVYKDECQNSKDWDGDHADSHRQDSIVVVVPSIKCYQSSCRKYHKQQQSERTSGQTSSQTAYTGGGFIFFVRVVRDHIDPHVWGTGSTPLLSNTSPTSFPCSGKVVHPDQETLPDTNCLFFHVNCFSS